jgi:23S rRNA pseudouridine1911/1915/1917 synthase
MLAPTGLSFSAGKLVGGADVSNGDRTWVVGPQEHGARLERFLAGPNRLASRGRAREALARGKVFVNAREVSAEDGGRLLAEGDQVRLWMDRPGSARSRPRASSAGEPSILYDDQDLVVLDKPAGLLSVPLARREEAPSAYEFVERHLRSRGKRRPHVVHRIDRDTSGLVVFATNARAQGALKEQFRRRQPERVYLAVVYGCPEPPSGTWRDHLVWDQDDLVQKASHPRDPRAKEATSDYRVLERLRGASLVEVRLVTGKRNQIRLQARLRGHTLVGEQRYVFGPSELRPVAFPRQALHAFRLAFRHPADGRRLAFESPLPADLRQLLVDLRDE